MNLTGTDGADEPKLGLMVQMNLTGTAVADEPNRNLWCS